MSGSASICTFSCDRAWRKVKVIFCPTPCGCSTSSQGSPTVIGCEPPSCIFAQLASAHTPQHRSTLLSASNEAMYFTIGSPTAELREKPVMPQVAFSTLPDAGEVVAT